MSFKMIDQLAAKGYWVFSGVSHPSRMITMRKEGKYSTIEVNIWDTGHTVTRFNHGLVIVASGYEWICPNMSCHEYNRQPGVTEEVTCDNCGKTYEVRDHIHAYD